MPTTNQPPSQTPAGWYPGDNGMERYWNGSEWTDQTRSSAPSAPAPGPQQGYYQGPPPKKSHTLRNVLLTLLVLGILSIGGCMALLAGAANEVDKAVKDSQAQDSKPGGPDNPLSIKPGQAFEVAGFNYKPGWTVGADFVGDIEVKNLRVENNRAKKDSALVEIKFWKGSEVLGLSDCTTEPIGPGTTVRLSCTSADKLPKQYDKITINDTF